MYLPVQIDGKTEGVIGLRPDMDQAQAIAAALCDAEVAERLAGRAVHRVVYLRGVVLNILTKPTIVAVHDPWDPDRPRW